MQRMEIERATWWSPAEPERRFGGDLRYASPYGYELRLTGSSQEIQKLGETTIRGTPLLGESADGHALTVSYLALSAMPGSTTLDLPVISALIGIHASEEEPLFETALLEFPNLAGWSGRTGLLRPSVQHQGKVAGVAFSSPEDLEAAVPGAAIRLGEATRAQAGLDGDSVHRRCQLMITLQRSGSLSEVMGRYVKPLQHLMTFANDQGAAITGLRLKTSGRAEAVIPVFDPVFDATQALVTQVPSPWKPLFRLEDAPNGFGSLIARWFELASLVGMPLLDLCLLPKYVPRLPFVEQRFLIYAQAAEGLHQRFAHRFDQRSLDPSLHDSLIATVRDRVNDEQLVRWAEARLANRRSFRERLLDLVEFAGESVAGILLPTPSKWVAEVRETRDELTHWPPGHANHSADAIEYLTLSLATVVSACVLSEIGFEAASVSRLISRSEDHGWALLLGRQLHPPVA